MSEKRRVSKKSTSCVGDSRAKTSAGPVEGRASRAPAPGSGMNSTVSCTSCSQPILLSKMSRREKDAGCPLCAECLSLLTTEHAPSKFLQQMSVPPTCESECLCLPWPTPTAQTYGSNQGGAAGRVGPKRQSLSGLVRRWTTPTVYGNHNAVGMSQNAGDGLSTQVKRWATPKAQDARSCGAQPNLTEQVRPGSLSANWVECLMGFPIGWTCPPGGPLDKATCKTRGSHRAQSVKASTVSEIEGSKR